MIDLVVPVLILMWSKWLWEGRYVYNQFKLPGLTTGLKLGRIVLLVAYLGWGGCFAAATYFLVQLI